MQYHTTRYSQQIISQQGTIQSCSKMYLAKIYDYTTYKSAVKITHTSHRGEFLCSCNCWMSDQGRPSDSRQDSHMESDAQYIF